MNSKSAGTGSVRSIKSVEQALVMLGLFESSRPTLTLNALAERSDMSKATAHRYAITLRKAGFLRYTDGLYSLGYKAFELSSAAIASLTVVQMAAPFLSQLLERTGQTSVLSVWEGGAPIVIRVAENKNRTAHISVLAGSRLLPGSAQGQVFRAFHAAGTSSRGLSAVRERGFAFNFQLDGIAALACPVLQADKVVAALAIVGVSSVIDVSESSNMATAVVDIAAGFSRSLGDNSVGSDGSSAPA